MSAYCQASQRDAVHRAYHDTEYGVPNRDDAVLCERLALEIFQAGLSWDLILRRRAGIGDAVGGFVPGHVAALDVAERDRLQSDPRMIRNRRKIEAIVHNAQVMCIQIDRFGSVAAWLDAHHPCARDEWVRLFRKTFRFTGPEVTGEFLMSLGYLPGAHDPTCPTYARILSLDPPWAAATPRSPQPKDGR
jgi:DNA-3-methyladenine glycosylase I